MTNFRRLVLGLVLVSLLSPSLRADRAWRDSETPFGQEILSYHPTFFGARPLLLEAASNNDVRAQYLYATLIREHFPKQYDHRYWCQWMTVAAINGDEDARGAWKGCLLEDTEYELLVEKAAFDDELKDDLIVHRFHRNWLKQSKKNDAKILNPLIDLAIQGDLWANFWLAASHNLGWGADRNGNLACGAYNGLIRGIPQNVGSLKLRVDGRVIDWDIKRYEAEGFYFSAKQLPALVRRPTGAFWMTDSAKRAANGLMPRTCRYNLANYAEEYAAEKAAAKRRASDLELNAQLLSDEQEKKAERRALWKKKQDWINIFAEFEDNISRKEFNEAKQRIQRLASTREYASGDKAFAIGEIMTSKEFPELYDPEAALGWLLQGVHNLNGIRAFQKFGAAASANELSASIPLLIAEAVNGNQTAGRLAARVLVESQHQGNLYAAYYLARFSKTKRHSAGYFFLQVPYAKRRAYWTGRELLDEVEEKLSSLEFAQAKSNYGSCMELEENQAVSLDETRFKVCFLAQLKSAPMILAPAGFSLSNETPETNDLYLTESERFEQREFYKEVAERERERETQESEKNYGTKVEQWIEASQLQSQPATKEKQDVWQNQLNVLLESENPILKTN